MSERAKQAKLRQLSLDETLRLIMSQPNGRQWIWNLLTRTKVFATCFDTRALQMAFNEGERNIGLQLLAELMRICPGQYTTMARENGESDERGSDKRRDPSYRADIDGDGDGDGDSAGPG